MLVNINKLWTVFSLDEAISGISNHGIEHDEYSFTLGKQHACTFDSIEKCETYIGEKLKEYASRKVGKNTRYVILPVYCFGDDKIFNID